MSEKKYYYNDPESGELVEITKECHDRIHFLRRLERRDGKPVGKMMMFSTVEDMDKQSNAKLLWENSPLLSNKSGSSTI